jgi:hypothetical protein
MSLAGAPAGPAPATRPPYSMPRDIEDLLGIAKDPMDNLFDPWPNDDRSPLPNQNLHNRFFDTLDSSLSNEAASLDLPRDYLQGLAAFETGYYDDHNRKITNPFGLTQAGRNNLSFPSEDAAIAYFMDQYGGQIRGATSPEDFAQRIQGLLDGKPVPGWHRYNSRNKDWIPNLVSTINSVGRHRQTWESQQGQ